MRAGGEGVNAGVDVGAGAGAGGASPVRHRIRNVNIHLLENALSSCTPPSIYYGSMDVHERQESSSQNIYKMSNLHPSAPPCPQATWPLGVADVRMIASSTAYDTTRQNAGGAARQ